jgi:transposase-like protein
MSTPRFTPEFKEEAVRQVVDRGYPASEVAERLGVSAHSLYKSNRSRQYGRTIARSRRPS